MTLADVFMWGVVGLFALCGGAIAWWFYGFERRVDEDLQAMRRAVGASRPGARDEAPPASAHGAADAR